MSSGLDIAILFAAFVPLIALMAAIEFSRWRRRKIEKSPQTEKLLRPPGHSLSLKIEKISDAFTDGILTSCGLSMMAGVFLFSLLTMLPHHPPQWFVWVLILGLFGFAGVSTSAAIRAFSNHRELQNLRLGLRGEQAVAEVLNEAAISGFRSFHDFQPESHWNIDHVAVSTRGVFLIETKACRRRGKNGEQKEHEIIYDGKFLQFPFYKTDEPINQAKNSAKWLSNFLEKKTGNSVWVEPLVIYPGWFIKNTGKSNFPVAVINTNYLVKFLKGYPEKIDPAQVQRIIAALEEKCRDVEF